MASTTIPFLSLLLSSQRAQAACLYGDLNPSCIGIYKVPMDENIASYVSTPEQLAKFAPGMNYVPPVPEPENYAQALRDIQSCETDIQENLQSLIYEGKLEEAGVVVLSLVPKLTMAGRVVVSCLNQKSNIELNIDPSDKRTSMRCFRVDCAMTTLLSTLGGLDIYLGQGLRGELGVITKAQLLILPEVKDVIENYNELRKALPEDTTLIAQSGSITQQAKLYRSKSRS